MASEHESAKLRFARSARPRGLGEAEGAEKALASFDLQSKYGPCRGLSRKHRWNRAAKLGLSPPLQILELISRSPPLGKLCCFDQHPHDSPAPPEAREEAEHARRSL